MFEMLCAEGGGVWEVGACFEGDLVMLGIGMAISLSGNVDMLNASEEYVWETL